MKTLLKCLIWLVLLLVAAAAALWFYLPVLNSYDRSGSLQLAGLKDKVEVVRDEKGMAYIRASNLHDAVMAQGFCAAQDRLFQMVLTRLAAEGRLCELVGEKALSMDTRNRKVGFLRLARKHAAMLDDETRALFQAYTDGVNAYMTGCRDQYPLDLKLAGLDPGPWTIEDSLAVLYYMGWGSSANMRTELATLMIIGKVGPEKAGEILPLNINPDDETPATQPRSRRRPSQTLALVGRALADSRAALPARPGPLGVGSNNWVAGGAMSPGGKPIVANDPHLDCRMLPGTWYPCAIITPDFRAVGISVPGTPGIVAGRNQYTAFGVTNAYGDMQDLFIEEIDPANPANYLQGGRSLPMEVVEESIKIKDSAAPGGFRSQALKVYYTPRGPLVADDLPGLEGKALSLRWAPAEAMTPQVPMHKLMTARSAADIDQVAAGITFIGLNYVFADVDGNIGWRVTGRLPLRSRQDGTHPISASDSPDDWQGWISVADMPHAMNPERGWLGTCNNKVVGGDYPFYYSSHLSPSWRYRRLIQLMDAPGKKSVDDHFRFQLDTVNLMAERMAPIMAKALLADHDSEDMGRLLADWNHVDDMDKAAPAVFQSVLRHFALLVYADQLGEEVARYVLDNPYYWQESLAAAMQRGSWDWFDDKSTPDRVESMDELLVEAASLARKELAPRLGDDVSKWKWGAMHQLVLVSPLRREGLGSGLLGAGSHPQSGSGETLQRGIYDFNKPYNLKVFDSLRMVADLADDEKVLAVLPGGVTARVFDPHTTDQVPAFVSGEKLYWWFSDAAIDQHAHDRQMLLPQ